MIKLKYNDTLTLNIVEQVYKNYPNEKIIIIIPNTKKQSEEEMIRLARKHPNLTISVTGGLDPSKRKFNNDGYQKRTYFTPMELSKIISIYREIEKGIDLSWTETQKAMYIYMELCNRMQYDENFIKGKDYGRSIAGLINGKAVCSGFAMIYKEALDRQGFENHYQNVEGEHSWNIAYLDGSYRAFELTWDTYNKGKNGCQFYYFNRKGEDFYSNKHHDLSGEKEEKEYQIIPYSDEEISANYRKITSNRVLNIPMNVSQKEFDSSPLIRINGIDCYIVKRNTGEVLLQVKNANQNIDSKSFYRKDGTQFLIIYTGDKSNLKNFTVIEGSKSGVLIGKMFSEQNLAKLPESFDQIIANKLLSKERLKRKMNDFNGYVGYIGLNRSIYYSEQIEQEKLNVIR